MIPFLHAFTRQPGALSILEGAAQTLLRRWVPKWHEVFFDPACPLFYERVGPAFRPILTGRRRLLSQLRQLAMYSSAVTQPENFMFTPDLRAHAHAILDLYRGPESGAWIFAVGDDLTPLDTTQDLYTHAFMIFAMAHYARATSDPRAHDAALSTAHYINTAFRAGVDAGFAETTDGAQPRRHESHMHLLEACLFARATWEDDIFSDLSDELVALFKTHLFDAQNSVLSEYFTQEFAPAPATPDGPIVCEAGHYYEWIWLLKKHDARAHDDICLQLLAWANTHGWDAHYGGLYDETTPDGTPINDTKRIWPLTEGLKANALLLSIAPDRDATKDHMTAMANLMNSAYIQKRGFWTETLKRDLTPGADYMPATTPYHVYFGIMEARDALRARGASKSWRMGPRNAGYAIARRASAVIRSVRFMLKTIRPVRD